jgi:hypothetical protein
MTIENTMQIVQTKAFINASPTTVVLSRPTTTRDNAGGSVRAYSPLDSAQTFRIEPLGGGAQLAPVRSTIDGVSIKPEYRIIAMPDADMKRHDQFVWRNGKYEIVFVLPFTDYQMTAEVAYLGIG